MQDGFINSAMLGAFIIGLGVGVVYHFTHTRDLRDELYRERVGRDRDRHTFNKAFDDMRCQRDEAEAKLAHLSRRTASRFGAEFEAWEKQFTDGRTS